MNNKIKHLEMIESVIQRMADNSFKLKEWTVAMVGIIGALSAQGTDKRFFLLVSIPMLAFWFLDSLYLQLDRKYRELYNYVREKKEDDIDFSMDISKLSSENNTLRYIECLFSKTEAGFYIPIGIVIIILAVILLKC